MSTRAASGKVMGVLASKLPNLIGGSADLDPSTHTALEGQGDFENPERAGGDMQGSTGGGWSYAGRNIHFGVREHAMGSILNGMAAHGGVIPFGATFLIFSDYMRPPMRLAALMEKHVIFVFTHDSIALGEDGPTHQPVEQLVGLRAIPHMLVIRPADANEVSVAWQVAIEQKDRPVTLVFTRQNLPVLDRKTLAPAEGLRRGGYILAEASGGKPDVILIATGSEVSLVLEARGVLEEKGIKTRVVSMPCWKIFDMQDEEYRRKVLPGEVKARLAVEAASPVGWERYTGTDGDVIGVTKFGASAPGKTVMKNYGFNVDNVVEHAMTVVEKGKKKG
jgi:transketolase